MEVGDEIILDQQLCDACGMCVKECPSGALEMLGKKISVDELTNELLKDKSFYLSSGGGVTFSGGEPLLQADFCAAVMDRLQQAGIHTALDTCGMVSKSQFEKVLPYADLVLFDLKVMDAITHQDFTGQQNERILKNLKFVRDTIQSSGMSQTLWIRTPLIPDATDDPKNLLAIGDFLASEMAGTVDRWELCAFNNLCRDKYRRLGMQWQFEETPLYTQSELDERYEMSTTNHFPKEKIIITGATRVQISVGG